MRRNIFILLAVVALLSSCAYQGTIVEKRFRPVPFTASLGIDAMYNFQLRDNTAQVHSQMVTPDVFASYRTGDYFNDLQPPPAHDDKELEGFRIPPPELREGPYEPVRVMQIRAPQRAANVALHSNVESDIKLLRWQTVRIVPIQSRQQVVAKIVLRAQDQMQSGAKIPRWQTVKVAQVQLPKAAATKVAIHKPVQIENAVKIPRSQTVKIVQVQSRQTAAAKVAVHTPSAVENAMKIPRWQTVRIIPIPSERAATKVVNPAPRHARSAGKTAASPNHNQKAAKTALRKETGAKVASKDHRKTVASVN